MLWTKTKSGKFIVKALYNALKSGSVVSFLMRGIWNLWMQPKVKLFVWEVTWGKALTLDQVQRRGCSLANRCYLCQLHEESMDHLLIHCEKNRVLWELLFALFTMSWVLPWLVRETLLDWYGSFVGKKRKKIWSVGPLMHLLDGLEGKKYNCFQWWCAFNPTAKKLFCLLSLVRD